MLIVLFKWIPLPRQLLPAFSLQAQMIHSLLLGTQLSYHMTCMYTHTQTNFNTPSPRSQKPTFLIPPGEKKNSCFLRTIINIRLLETPMFCPSYTRARPESSVLVQLESLVGSQGAVFLVLKDKNILYDLGP